MGLPLHFLEFYQRLIQIQIRAQSSLGKIKPELDGKTIGERINRGLPLVSFGELAIDWPLLKEVFAEVTAAFAAHAGLFGELPRGLRGPRVHPSLLRGTVKAWYENTELPSTIAVDNEKEYLILHSIIQATLRPFLVSQAEALLPQVEPERWRRRYCPICGGQPDFAFLDKETGARWLICSRCDARWLFQRLQCPYCGNQDQNELAYFTDEDELYRLYVCERCKGYLKAIDLRKAKSEFLVPLERVLTLEMDRQAREEGYSFLNLSHQFTQPDSSLTDSDERYN